MESPWRLAQPSIISSIVLMKGQGKVSALLCMKNAQSMCLYAHVYCLAVGWLPNIVLFFCDYCMELFLFFHRILCFIMFRFCYVQICKLKMYTIFLSFTIFLLHLKNMAR